MCTTTFTTTLDSIIIYTYFNIHVCYKNILYFINTNKPYFENSLNISSIVYVIRNQPTNFQFNFENFTNIPCEYNIVCQNGVNGR